VRERLRCSQELTKIPDWVGYLIPFAFLCVLCGKGRCFSLALIYEICRERGHVAYSALVRRNLNSRDTCSTITTQHGYFH
jgi:hypothetical protein